MAKKSLIINAFIFTFIIFSLHSFSQKKFLWPLPQGIGKVDFKIGNIVNPITGLPVFNDGYFISAPFKTQVYAVDDGVISSVTPFQINSPDLILSMAVPKDFESYKKRLSPDFIINKPWLCENNIIGAIGLKLNDGSTVYYSGLVPGEEKLKKGMKVKKGDIIGYVGYFRVILKEPCIQISLSTSAGKVGDIGIPMLGENNHLEKIIKIEKKRI